MKPRLYLAAPLFSKAEIDFNSRLAGRLSRWLEVYLPQRDGGLLVELIASGHTILEASEIVFRGDTSAILQSKYFLILLDGRTIDEGASFELGFAYAHDKVCVGLQTDPRRLLTAGNNPMIARSLGSIFATVGELETWAERLAQDVG